jgi:predicted Zn-dependent protease
VSVGRPLTKTDLDARAASAVEQLWGALDQINELSQLLANTTIIANDQALINLGYTQAEVTLLRAAVNDLGSANGLWGVAHGQKTVPSVNNFFFNGQQITGVNWSG